MRVVWITLCVLFLQLIGFSDALGQPNNSVYPTYIKYQRASYYLNDTLVQKQYYTILDSVNVYEVTEIGEFVDDPTVYAYSRIKLIDSVYEEIEIALFSNKKDTLVHTLVKRTNDHTYLSFTNRQPADTLHASKKVLFAGPNPYYDYTNCLVNNERKKSRNDVVSISWSDGQFHQDAWEFYRPSTDIFIVGKTHSGLTEITHSPFDGLLFTVTNGEHFYEFDELFLPPAEGNSTIHH